MIGRHREKGVFADVGALKIAQVVLAGLLVLAAIAIQHLIDPSDLLDAVVIGLCIGSLALTGLPIVLGAARGLLRLETNVDELVSLAIIASIILGEWTAGAIVAFIMVLGGLIEEVTSERARRHIERLGASSPDHAILVEDDGTTREVEATALKPGLLILVRPGDVVAADGKIESGESEIDESMLTGESLPVYKGPGHDVVAATINTHGALRVRVERVGDESTHARILRIVHEAEQHRAPIIRVAERYAKWFTPAILVLAVGVWLFSGDVYRAVTMLIVGCPCAFVLATPTAVMAALGAASRNGVLIKGGKYLEACAGVTMVAFDKTGTLTEGTFAVSEVVALRPETMTRSIVLAKAARLEAGSEHPLARAIVECARSEGIDIDTDAAIKRVAGLGVTEVDDGRDSPWRIGSLRFLEGAGASIGEAVRDRVNDLARGGLTPILLAEGDAIRGLIALEDALREESAGVLVQLRDDGLSRQLMITGDTDAVAARVAEQLELPEENVRAQHLPEQKYELIRELERSGERVCYVGDGTNDGPALAVASVGVSIGSRENTVALETADAVLMRDGLQRLPFLLRLGRATARTINQNLILFGLIFNATLLALSAYGALTPILGAIGHNVGSVAVVLNSARLLGMKADVKGEKILDGRYSRGKSSGSPADHSHIDPA